MRIILRLTCFLTGFIIFLMNLINTASAQLAGNQILEVVNIGTRRELFVDRFMIDTLLGKAELKLHYPELQNIAILHDAPWEGNFCGYHSIFKDENKFRMYYRGANVLLLKGKGAKFTHPYYFCYAESNDGIQWARPDLGIYDFEGSKKNNIVLASGNMKGIQVNLGDNATIFKDDNPDINADERYKALALSKNLKGLQAFKSADGIHWSLICEQAVITDGAFDSQNIAFWDNSRKEYRAYWRIFSDSVRAIRTATSKDFIHWKNQADLKYIDSPAEHLYTNQVMPYFRAPHIFIGFPTRYVNRVWSSEAMSTLPEPEDRKIRSEALLRFGTALTEGLFMASRDGVNFKRWNEAFLKPGIERKGTWNYGQQFIGWGVLETKSSLDGAPNELSIYATEGGWIGTGNILRRYTLRLDGFVSAYAPMEGGELITKTLIFDGNKLTLNFSSSAAGDIKVEIQDKAGKPFSGFALKDCHPIFGDSIEREVFWNNGSDLSVFKGRPVRIRFTLRDSDLYSFQFK